VSSESDLRNSRERERLSGELQSVVQFPAFARERLDPGLKPFFNKPDGSTGDFSAVEIRNRLMPE
jgi:hypothetical protein